MGAAPGGGARFVTVCDNDNQVADNESSGNGL